MALRVYDFRHDLRNVLVTPQIRARFMRFPPGQVASIHSHDLGHEVFLVLQGRAHFRIAGEEAELGPGQMCVALANESHQVRVIGDEPMTLYLSVTPHIQPTHTGRSETDEREPHRYLPSGAYDVDPGSARSDGEVIAACAAAAGALAEEAALTHQRLEQESAKLAQALAAGDRTTAGSIRDRLWDGIRRSFQEVQALGQAWNELAPRADGAR